MIYIFGFIFIILYFAVPVFQCIVHHPFLVGKYGAKDLYNYIKNKDWNCAPYGQITCYIADNATSFGCGKTLSATQYLTSIYKQYNGKMVYDGRRKKFVKQKIHILSNVDFLTIPYERLISLQQFVQETDQDLIALDDENDTLTVTYMLIDEASSQLNSRDFKTNFNGLFISRLLTARHVRASIILTSQRSGMIDKLMREVTNLYIGCNKLWRFQRLYYYDAYEIENAQTPSLVRPIARKCWFVTDSAFSNYDTYSSVATLLKNVKEGKVLSDQEIIDLQGNQDINLEGVDIPKRNIFGLRRKRKRGKDKE